jgi:hypothetical protein
MWRQGHGCRRAGRQQERLDENGWPRLGKSISLARKTDAEPSMMVKPASILNPGAPRALQADFVLSLQVHAKQRKHSPCID